MKFLMKVILISFAISILLSLLLYLPQKQTSRFLGLSSAVETLHLSIEGPPLESYVSEFEKVLDSCQPKVIISRDKKSQYDHLLEINTISSKGTEEGTTIEAQIKTHIDSPLIAVLLSPTPSALQFMNKSAKYSINSKSLDSIREILSKVVNLICGQSPAIAHQVNQMPNQRPKHLSLEELTKETHRCEKLFVNKKTAQFEEDPICPHLAKLTEAYLKMEKTVAP